MTESLKPCPFCGEKPRIGSRSAEHRDGVLFHTAWKIECRTPGHHAATNRMGTKAEAVAAWNRRQPLPDPPE